MAHKILISVDDLKEKLGRLRESASDLTDTSVMFGKYLCRFLNSKKISPQGFVKIWERAYQSIRLGKEKGKKLSHPLIGMSGLEYYYILSEKKRIIELAFPENFITELRKIEKSNK